jgi:hypothetical protein
MHLASLSGTVIQPTLTYIFISISSLILVSYLPFVFSVTHASSSPIIGSSAMTGFSSNGQNNNLEASATNASSMNIWLGKVTLV